MSRHTGPRTGHHHVIAHMNKARHQGAIPDAGRAKPYGNKGLSVSGHHHGTVGGGPVKHKAHRHSSRGK